MPPPSPNRYWFQSLGVARFNRCVSLGSSISEAIDEEPVGGGALSTHSPFPDSGVPLGTVYGTFVLMLFD